ncbi:GGDEF domain-containing protein [Sporosarcina luteola]|uniref:GGDEF domain-containing protein n=1 Tax=Sporosarcina luteola TaxID=582850 RepID=UPI00203A700A|nr:GGDEF domain-containing protein [Sporosarcina luteola]MCM3709372.1 GGDEF domain-containing protein [Sporosarcina luteola]
MTNRNYLSVLFYIAFLILSILANNYPVLLDFGLTFFMPTIFLLIILSLYSLPIGIISALITAGVGLYSDGSIVGFVLLITEITVVGLLLKYRGFGEFHSVLLYWSIIGMPVFAVYIYVFSDLDSWFAALALISKLLNNILCALAAEIILTYIPLRKWIGRVEMNEYSARTLISHIILVAIVLPYLFFIIGDARYTQNQIERSISSQLERQASIISNDLQDWDEHSELALPLQGVFRDAKIDSSVGNMDEQSLQFYIMGKEDRIVYTNAPATLESTVAKINGEGYFIEMGKSGYKWMPDKSSGIDDIAIIDETSYLYTVEDGNNMRIVIEAPLRSLFEKEIRGFALEYANLLLFIILGIGFIAILKVYLMRSFSKLSETTTGLPKKLKGLAHINWPTSRMVEFNKLTDNFKEMSHELTEMFNELQESKNRLHFMAYYDSLTGMKNRPYFMGVLKNSVESAGKESPHALLFMDLNGFKGINDTYGHETGDIVLQQIAKRLTMTCGEKGLLARLGGDEFVVLLPFSSRELAADMAECIMKQVEKPIHINGNMLQVGISIGISLYFHDSHTVDELMYHGDMAMYASKAAGGSRFTFYDSISHEGLVNG